MARLTIDDLKRIKEKHKEEFSLREGGYRAKVTVHMGTCGIAAGAREIMTALMAELREAGAEGVIVATSGCAGLCSKEPLATVEMHGQPPVKYGELTEAKIKTIVKEHVIGGAPVEKLALVTGSETAY
ncbi:MAG: (2Fe-2S) ferredoxin domain-containing protein [Nitrospirae bacterium]|nr:(2Fe-2S) ferredoxin domain-containing protein [Nitrospirota bacterium]